MDGDNTAKSFEQGANSAVKETDLSSGIHESVKQTVGAPKLSTCINSVLMPGDMQPAAGEKTTGTGTSIFSKDGALGSMFNGTASPHRAIDASSSTLILHVADGAVGGTAQKIGGPLDKEGSIGQHFNADGKIGGMVQENLANKK